METFHIINLDYKIPFDLCSQDGLELVAHEAVDEEVRGGIEDEEPVHEAGEAEEPGWGEEVGTADDALGHEELCTVDDEPGDVTEEKHNDYTDKDAGKNHLVLSTELIFDWLTISMVVAISRMFLIL